MPTSSQEWGIGVQMGTCQDSCQGLEQHQKGSQTENHERLLGLTLE